ncbi:hypothetical protein Q0Z83_004000 [Actinoplanes sichuanensis]|uniref:Antitoxin n=1 Tax=Actinoplanes sichuanensis TaxID=512349 RepID=A0ABW4AGT3_9ACTN|nr:hypothetical protein [Actinoplanes sichuanensis]BEL02209.1 hypothetical protein Q0Z83_004000 [Actinoplanes sichuanensis]
MADDKKAEAATQADRFGALLGRVRPEDYVETVETRRHDGVTALDPEQEKWNKAGG